MTTLYQKWTLCALLVLFFQPLQAAEVFPEDRPSQPNSTSINFPQKDAAYWSDRGLLEQEYTQCQEASSLTNCQRHYEKALKLLEVQFENRERLRNSSFNGAY